MLERMSRQMGYILPIQSHQYANRMDNTSNLFIYIDKVEAAKMWTKYRDWQNEWSVNKYQQVPQQKIVPERE